MRKVRQFIVGAVVFILLAGSSVLAGWLAENNLWIYFSKENVFKEWIKWTYIFYAIVAAAEFLITFIMLYWGRSGITEWKNRKRRFPQAVAFTLIVNAVIIAAASYLLALLHRVTTGDLIYVSHGLYLSITLGVLLISLLFIFIIKPIARKINY